MSRRYVARDETANTAIRSADRRGRKHHAPGCHVDGHTGRHRVNGFWCDRCEEQVDDTIVSLLTTLDKKAGGRW